METPTIVTDLLCYFFSSRRRHTRFDCDWSSDVCSSDLHGSPGFDFQAGGSQAAVDQVRPVLELLQLALDDADQAVQVGGGEVGHGPLEQIGRASCRERV